VHLAVVLQCAATNTDVETFFQESKLVGVDLAVPDLAAVVDHPHFMDEVVNFEILNHFALQIEIMVDRLLLLTVLDLDF